MIPDNSAVNDLAAQWWPLAVKTAHRCAERWRVPHLADEFESAAGGALLAGVRRYLEREGDKPPVAAFVKKAVAWAAYEVLQDERQQRAIGTGADGRALEALLAARGPDPLEGATTREAAALAAALLDRAALTANEREAVVRHFADGVPCEVLAEERGCSRQNVYQLATSGLKKLRAVAGVQGAPANVQRPNSRTEAVRRMRAAGVPVAEIVRALGVTRAAVYCCSTAPRTAPVSA